MAMKTKEIKAEIRETRRQMKEAGVKRTSCFNGGLTSDEYRYNSRMFKLETDLKDALKRELVTV